MRHFRSLERVASSSLPERVVFALLRAKLRRLPKLHPNERICRYRRWASLHGGAVVAPIVVDQRPASSSVPHIVAPMIRKSPPRHWKIGAGSSLMESAIFFAAAKMAFVRSRMRRATAACLPASVQALTDRMRFPIPNTGFGLRS